MSNPNRVDSAVGPNQLGDCYPYRRLYEGLADLVDRETGTVDYGSDQARGVLTPIDEELHERGFKRPVVQIAVAFALRDLERLHKFLNYMEDPGDLLVKGRDGSQTEVQYA